MRQFLRGLALLSSIVMLVSFVYYRTHKPVEAGLSQETVFPSSKVGTAMELPSTDRSGRDPVVAQASPTPTPNSTVVPEPVLIPSSKSGRILTPSATVTPAPGEPPTVLPGSKSIQVVPPANPTFMPGSKSERAFPLPSETPEE